MLLEIDLQLFKVYLKKNEKVGSSSPFSAENVWRIFDDCILLCQKFDKVKYILNKFDALEDFQNVTKNKLVEKEQYASHLLKEISNIINT